MQAAIATADDESRSFVVDLDSHIEQHVQDEPLKNYPSVSPLFENREAPYQLKLKKVYPWTRFGNKLRRFKSSWYSEYKWLEYNEELDACFCFTCRRFLPNPIYEEREMRKLRGCTVAFLVSLNTDHKQWLFAVFNASIPFYCVARMNLILSQLEEKWKKIHKNLPKNAKFTSPDIQNGVIEVLSSLSEE